MKYLKHGENKEKHIISGKEYTLIYTRFCDIGLPGIRSSKVKRWVLLVDGIIFAVFPRKNEALSFIDDLTKKKINEVTK